tara:strand:- start:104 stop:739 length:636 start_codon:yes stop_codon:yes gene_type:complete
MSDNNHKLETFLYNKIENIKDIKILEFGVREGVSTKLFVNLAEKNNGKVFSVDLDNYSNLIKSNKWKFIHSRDDNFQFIKGEVEKEFDVILLDSQHEAYHVKNIIYNYYDLLKKGGYFFIDDISWLPYTKNSYRDHFWCEVNNKETFNIILDIYSENISNFDLEYSFISSGFALFKKKTNDKLNPTKKKRDRSFSIRNLLRLTKKKILFEK